MLDGLRVVLGRPLLVVGPLETLAHEEVTLGEIRILLDALLERLFRLLVRVAIASLGQIPSVDNTPPTVTTVSPTSGATGVSATANAVANFSEAINSSTVTGTTFLLRDAANNLVLASISTSGNQITLNPSSSLAAAATYTATIIGGASGVKDLAGNALASNFTWSFTTANC